MAKRSRVLAWNKPLTQYDQRYSVPGTAYYQAGNRCDGWRQDINQTDLQYFANSTGRQMKVTGVRIDYLRVKVGTVNGKIGQQKFVGCPVNTTYGVYNELLNGSGIDGMFPQLTSVSNAAIIKATAKLDKMQVGGGENLVTIKETFKMIRDPLSSVAKLGREMVQSAKRKTHYTRDYVKYYKNLLDSCANLWLQYRYGVMPLVYDAEGAMELLEDHLWEWQNQVKTVHAVCRHKESVYLKETASAGYASAVVCEGFATCTHKASSQIYFRDKLWMKDARRLEEFGLSPTQLPALAWELIPFSFVADWGINMGDWLKAIAPKPTIEVLGSLLSYKRTVRQPMTVTLTSFQPGFLKSSYFKYYKTLQRSINPATPSFPGFTMRSLSVKRQIDALSLGWSLWPSKTIEKITNALDKKTFDEIASRNKPAAKHWIF